jgi:hypothetical protein
MPAKKAKTAKKAKKEAKEEKAKETIKVEDEKAPKLEDVKVTPVDSQIAKEEKDILEEISEENTTQQPEDSDISTPTEPLESKVPEEPEKTDEKEAKKITSFRQIDSESSDVAKSQEISGESEDTPNKVLEIKGAKEEETKPEEQVEETEGGESKMSSENVKKWLQDVRPDTTKEVDKKGKPNLKVIITVGVILLLFGILIGGVFYYRSNVGDEAEEATSSPSEEIVTNETITESPTSTPTPTPEEELDLSNYSVNILNGSGIAGEAGRASSLLEELGFSELDTGNADSYEYTTTVISLKKEVPDGVYEKIKESLSTDYIVEKSDEALEEDSTYDVVITVGSRKAEE